MAGTRPVARKVARVKIDLILDEEHPYHCGWRGLFLAQTEIHHFTPGSRCLFDRPFCKDRGTGIDLPRVGCQAITPH